MKVKLRVPFFEIGVKNYLYGDEVLKLAIAADIASQKYDIDVLFIAPYTEIRRINENTDKLIILAPYMDTIRPGRGLADILPESIKAAGAKGVVINHCEKPMTLNAIKHTIERANELDLLSFACADSIIEAKAIAHLHPDIINPEPSELIGSGKSSGIDFMENSTKAIKEIYYDILVEQAAGISNSKQVYDIIFAGADAVGVSSGVATAKNPCEIAEEMIKSVREAFNDKKYSNLKGFINYEKF